MGREVRKVPRGWEHPRTPDGALIPLHDRSYAKEAADWDAECLKWCEGWRPDYYDTKTCKVYPNTSEGYAAWNGERPVESEYMPDFGDTADMFVMYEDTSEGTPISPAFETVEELARWLADNGASAFAGRTATYEQWLATCRRGHAVSMVSTGGKFVSGVEGLGEPINPYGARKID